MKRIQLFELEDLHWFPDSIRVCMTRMITVVHRWLGTSDHVSKRLADLIKRSGRRHIVDFCSGDGGPMPDVLEKLHSEFGLTDICLTLTDLYPNGAAADRVNGDSRSQIRYVTEPVDATDSSSLEPKKVPSIRTMVSSFHHLPPAAARKVLSNAASAGDPILIYEISDNGSPPKYLWWIGLPLNLIFGMVVAAFTRPMTIRQFLFSFVIPIIPICFAWDGAISNARTYTMSDMEELTAGLGSDQYEWEMGVVIAKPANQLYLLGMPLGA